MLTLTYVDKVVSVLVDGASKKDRTILSGYTESDKVVHFNGTTFFNWPNRPR